MKLIFAALLAIFAIPAHAGAGGVLFNGSSPSSDANQNITPTTVVATTVTVSAGTGSACFSADNPTLVVDCGNHRVLVSTVVASENGASNVNAFPYSPLMVFGNANTYLQMVIQNLSNGTNASGDLILTTDLGGDTSFYLDIGVNSSRFSQSGQTVEASSSTFIGSSDSDLVIWADTNGGLNRPSGAGVGHVIIGSSNPVSGNTGVDISSKAVAMFGSTFTVTNNGITNNPSQPRAQLQWSGTQTYNASAATQVFWSTIVKNVQGMFVATSSGIVTVPVGGGGSYHIDASFGLTKNASATYWEMDVLVNGGRVCTGVGAWVQSASANAQNYASVSCDVDLNAGDAVSITVTSDFAGSWASDLQTDRFNIRKY